MNPSDPDAIDLKMMARCIALSREAVGEGVEAGVGVAVGEGEAGEGEAAGADSLLGGAETPVVDEALPVQAEATPTMTSGMRSRASDERLVHV